MAAQQGSGGHETVVVRSRGSRVLGALIVVVAVASLAVTVRDGTDALATWACPSLLLGVLGWAAFWQPGVEVSDGGVRLLNTLRTIEVPWPAIESVDGRYGLRLATAYGGFTAWGAPAPAGRGRRRREDSEAAVVVRRRLEDLRAAGWLDAPRLEQPRARVVWHRATVAVVAGLVAAGAALALLG